MPFCKFGFINVHFCIKISQTFALGSAKIIIEQVPNCVVYKFYSDHVGFSNDCVGKKILVKISIFNK